MIPCVLCVYYILSRCIAYDNFVMVSGVPRLDEIFVTVLSSSMLLSGVIACFLDNTMPGETPNYSFLGPRKASR